MGFHSWYPILTHGETGDVATVWMFWTKIKLYCSKTAFGIRVGRTQVLDSLAVNQANLENNCWSGFGYYRLLVDLLKFTKI